MGAYFGSKATAGLCQPIIALMPPHDTYIETHLGDGAIMQHNTGVRSLVVAWVVFLSSTRPEIRSEHLSRASLTKR